MSNIDTAVKSPGSFARRVVDSIGTAVKKSGAVALCAVKAVCLPVTGSYRGFKAIRGEFRLKNAINATNDKASQEGVFRLMLQFILCVMYNVMVYNQHILLGLFSHLFVLQEFAEPSKRSKLGKRKAGLTKTNFFSIGHLAELTSRNINLPGKTVGWVSGVPTIDAMRFEQKLHRAGHGVPQIGELWGMPTTNERENWPFRYCDFSNGAYEHDNAVKRWNVVKKFITAENTWDLSGFEGDDKWLLVLFIKLTVADFNFNNQYDHKSLNKYGVLVFPGERIPTHASVRVLPGFSDADNVNINGFTIRRLCTFVLNLFPAFAKPSGVNFVDVVDNRVEFPDVDTRVTFKADDRSTEFTTSRPVTFINRDTIVKTSDKVITDLNAVYRQTYAVWKNRHALTPELDQTGLVVVVEADEVVVGQASASASVVTPTTQTDTGRGVFPPGAVSV